MLDYSPGIGINAAQELERIIQTEAARSEIPAASDPPPTAWTRRNVKSYPRLPRQELPAPQPTQEPLAVLLARRVSCRHFSRAPLQLTALSSVLGNGMSTRQDRGLSRPYPSAGARWPIEAYLLPLHVDGLRRGVYHYDANGHALTVLDEGMGMRDVVDCFAVQEFDPLPQALVVLTAVFARTWTKYGARGSRFVYQEAGAVAMALDLAALALGLSTIWLGGFNDARLSGLLDLNWELELEAPTLTLGLGTPASCHSC